MKAEQLSLLRLLSSDSIFEPYAWRDAVVGAEKSMQEKLLAALKEQLRETQERIRVVEELLRPQERLRNRDDRKLCCSVGGFLLGWACKRDWE